MKRLDKRLLYEDLTTGHVAKEGIMFAAKNRLEQALFHDSGAD